MISSLALPRPTIAGRREQPPTSGSSPTFTSMIPAIASSAITRKSAASASSNAPPRQAPWIWQMVGLGISSSRFHQFRIGRRKRRSRDGSSDSSRRSLRSMPEENIGAVAAHDHAAHRGVGRGVLHGVPEVRISSPLKALRFSARCRTRWRTAAAILDSDQ